MGFLTFSSVKRTINHFSTRSRHDQKAYNPGTSQVLHPEYDTLADLPEVPEVSESFTQDLSMLTIEDIDETPELTIRSSARSEPTVQDTADEGFLLTSIFDRQLYSRSLFPRGADDHVWKRNPPSQRFSGDQEASQDMAVPRLAHVAPSKTGDEPLQAGETDNVPYWRLALPLTSILMDAKRSMHHYTHLRTSSNEAADTLFFARTSHTNLASQQQRIISTATTAIADTSCIVHDQSDLLDAVDHDTPRTSYQSSIDGVCTEALNLLSDDVSEVAGPSHPLHVPASLNDSDEEIDVLPEAPAMLWDVQSVSSVGTSYTSTPTLSSVHRSPSQCSQSSPFAQSWEAGTSTRSSSQTLGGSIARAAAALSTEVPSPLPPLPNSMPVNGPSGLPEPSSWHKGTSFCQRKVSRMVSPASITAKINKNKAARATVWHIKEGKDKVWRTNPGKRNRKTGPQAWDEDKHEDEVEEHLGTVGRRMKMEKWVRDQLCGVGVHSATAMGSVEGEWKDKIAAEVRLDAENETRQQLLQENMELKQNVLAVEDQRRDYDLEEVTEEIMRVQHQFATLEKDIFDPYADHGSTVAETTTFQIACSYDTSTNQRTPSTINVVTYGDYWPYAVGKEESADPRTEMRRLWRQSEARRIVMQQLWTKLMNLFEEERLLRRRGMNDMSWGFLNAEATNFGDKQLQPGACWVDYTQRYREQCPVRINSDDENYCRRVRKRHYDRHELKLSWREH